MEAALAAGVDAVQLRDRELPAADLHRLGRDLSALARRAGAQLFVNDRIDIAVALRAHGVQLGAGSIPVADARRLLPPGALIGYSAHSAAEAEGAALGGADFILLAPVYETGSKPGAQPLGADRVRRTAAALPIPLFALGGIRADRVPELVDPSGAGRPVAGVAVISAILGADDPGAAARELVAAAGGRA